MKNKILYIVRVKQNDLVCYANDFRVNKLKLYPVQLHFVIIVNENKSI